MRKYLFCFVVLCLRSFNFGLAISPWPVPPSVISTPGIDASSPSVAIDSTGRAVAVWIENDVVMTSQQPFNGQWASPPTAISGSNASNPQVVVDGSGTVTALWLQGGVVMTASQPFSGSWSVPSDLSASGAAKPSMAMDANGDIVAVWTLSGAIQSLTQSAGGSWPSIPDVLASDSGDFPAIAINDGGLVCAVWQQTDQTIWAISKSMGGTWGPAQQISSMGTLAAYPEVAVTGEGDLIAAWFQYQLSSGTYTNVTIQSTDLLAGGSWNTPTQIGVSDPVDPSRLELVLSAGSEDTAIACWTTMYGDSLFSAFRNNWEAGRWEGAFPLVACNPSAYSVDVVANPLGDAYIVFMDQDPITASIEVLGTVIPLAAINNSVFALRLLSTGGVNGYPSLAVNRIGSTSYGAGTWENYNGSYNNIQALTYKFPTVLPPTQISAVQQVNNYGVFTQYNNIITWLPSASPNIVAYVVERNGIFLTVLMENTFATQYIDVNQVLSAPPSYAVYAVNKNGYISSAATLTPNGGGGWTPGP